MSELFSPQEPDIRTLTIEAPREERPVFNPHEHMTEELWRRAKIEFNLAGRRDNELRTVANQLTQLLRVFPERAQDFPQDHDVVHELTLALYERAINGRTGDTLVAALELLAATRSIVPGKVDYQTISKPLDKKIKQSLYGFRGYAAMRCALPDESEILEDDEHWQASCNFYDVLSGLDPNSTSNLDTLADCALDLSYLRLAYPDRLDYFKVQEGLVERLYAHFQKDKDWQRIAALPHWLHLFSVLTAEKISIDNQGVRFLLKNTAPHEQPTESIPEQRKY